ncbi:hypothetical protein BD779DRAFT_1483997 [Infundibulicybe gibba]|nr:hypothetical protein BD779DRAFT_1483997 [Infundibulicybe gibba]
MPIELKTTSYISNISSPPASFSFQHNTYTVKHKECPSIKDHASAFDQFLSNLKAHADISPGQIAHVCHRVVHGGEYSRPVLINNESYHHIEVLSDLAPLGLLLGHFHGAHPTLWAPGATRSGDIDPCLLMHYADIHENGEEALKKAENMLNKASGWKALAGQRTLVRLYQRRPDAPIPRPPSAGVSTGGQKPDQNLGGRVDALVFSGGIGENSQELRQSWLVHSCLGFAPLDGDKNGDLGDMAVVDIAAGGDGKRILVCKTDEQAEMARECVLDDQT